MFLIRTEIRPSKIHGLGCFSLEDVKKGQRLWVFDSRIDTRFEVSEISSLPSAAVAFVKTYGYQEFVEGKRVVTLCGDNAKYINHSDDPNVITSQQEKDFEIAARDIGVGEELTSNYRVFDLDVDVKLSAS